jgi:hypothetical protein
MDTLPFIQKPGLFDRDFVEDPSEVGTVDTDAVDQFRLSILAEQIDFRLPGAGDVDMSRLVILCVDNEAKAESPVNDDHATP